MGSVKRCKHKVHIPAFTWPHVRGQRLCWKHRKHRSCRFLEVPKMHWNSSKRPKLNFTVEKKICCLASKDSTAIKPFPALSQRASLAVSYHESIFSVLFACLRTDTLHNTLLLCKVWSSIHFFCFAKNDPWQELNVWYSILNLNCHRWCQLFSVSLQEHQSFHR